MAESAAPLRRLAFVALCAGALAGLLSCRSSTHRTTDTARLKDAGAVALPTRDAPGAAAQGEPVVRVAVLKDAPAVRITGGKARKVLNAAGQSLLQPPDAAALEVRAAAGSVVLNGVPGAEPSLTIESSSADDCLSANGQELARVVRVYAAPRGGGLNVIAHLNMEAYLCGVLAGEVPFDRWHTEALRAQAIASRSYAFSQLKKSANEPYDLESTVMSQVFKAGYRANPVLNAALGATRGLVLTYNGAVFPAYFHSTCGGQTEVASSVFPEQPPIKPLSGVPCTYCQQSPSFRWKMVLDKAALEQKLAAAAAAGTLPWPQGARIQSLEFLDAAGAPLPPLGRAAQVLVKHERGEMKFQGNQFRLLAGARELKSLLFERVVDNGPALDIAGCGFGHGVGLCQWGSQGMAQAGFTHAQILGKYYPGAALTRMY